jgi:hypothetical protein
MDDLMRPALDGDEHWRQDSPPTLRIERTGKTADQKARIVLRDEVGFHWQVNDLRDRKELNSIVAPGDESAHFRVFVREDHMAKIYKFTEHDDHEPSDRLLSCQFRSAEFVGRTLWVESTRK